MQDWHYSPAEDLEQPLIERLRRFPREPDILQYGLRSMAGIGLRVWLKCYHRLRIEGREHLPKSGSFVVVANHSSHLDALCLISAMPLSKRHQVFPAAAEDYFFVSLPRIALAAIFINALPFGRQTHVRQSMTLCRELLQREGNVLVVFPEGTRSKDGGLGEFKPGIGRLLQQTGVPVIPCHIDGAGRALPKGGWLPRPRRIVLRFGTPRTYANWPHTKEGAAQIADDLREAVCRLSDLAAGGTSSTFSAHPPVMS